jgi:glutamate racemase
MLTHQGIKALVVACNTATAAAIHTLRGAYPDLPIVGIEPALKPAAATSQTGVVGVMATRATLNSEKFARLLQQLHGAATFLLRPCDGLADAIERSDGVKTQALCRQYTMAMGHFGTGVGDIDTLVLGCTHYPFVGQELQNMVGLHTTLIEGGAPLAKHTKRLLEKAGLARYDEALLSDATVTPGAAFYSTGSLSVLNSAALRWLGANANAQALDLP